MSGANESSGDRKHSEGELDSSFVEIQHGSDLYQQELRLRDALLRQPLGLAITQKDIDQDATQMHFGMASSNGELLACLIIVDLGGHAAKLRQMAVAEKFQRRGIGSELIRRTESVLRERGFQSLELHARVPAIGFYERLSYQPVGDRFVEVTIEHQKMVRDL